MGPHRYSWATVEELAPRIWSGEVDVRELVEETLEGIRRNDDRSRAFITVLDERARPFRYRCSRSGDTCGTTSSWRWPWRWRGPWA